MPPPYSVHPPAPENGESSDEPVRVLVVDDDPSVRSALSRMLGSRGLDVVCLDSGERAVASSPSLRPDVALVDVNMPVMDGYELTRHFHAARPSVPVVLMTGDEDIDLKPSIAEGVFDVMRKPFPESEHVVRLVQNAARQHRLLVRAEALERRLKAEARFGELVGDSSPMTTVYRFIDNAAPTDSTVLITGESGTGKELVARAIHAHSKRRTQPLVTINCAAIPEELVESELFGHAKGAFTGANSARAGLFESADGGTLFLDEVGDLPLSVQAHLLRALQLGEIKRVGADEVRRVNVRVIAATNVELESHIQEGSFRRDLFYRLNVLAIQLPALRDRGHDIVLLAERILDRLSVRMAAPAKHLSSAALTVLQRHRWPGNVRELENALERAFVLARATTIEASDLPMALAGEPPKDNRALPTRTFTPMGLYLLPFSEAKKKVMDRFEMRYVDEAMQRASGNVAEAARQAGLDRSNFRRIVKKLKEREDGDDDSPPSLETTMDVPPEGS